MSTKRVLTDLELLRIETELLWGNGERAPDLVLAGSSAGLEAIVGEGVPHDIARALLQETAAAQPRIDLSSPPAALERCRKVLEKALGQVELRPGSGPSYLIEHTVACAPKVPLIRSDGPDLRQLRDANPGNWGLDEWQALLDGRLGPWVMATTADRVISICHTPVRNARAAEAGVWTLPEFRGQGHAASVTAEWASLMRPTGRFLFYSTSRTNQSSQNVAARLRLRPIGCLWQLGRVKP